MKRLNDLPHEGALIDEFAILFTVAILTEKLIPELLLGESWRGDLVIRDQYPKGGHRDSSFDEA